MKGPPGAGCFHWPALFSLFFITESVEEEDKQKEKEKAKEIFRPSGLLSACFGNPECVSEAKRIGSFLLALLACFCLLAFVGVLALLASLVLPALLDLLACLASPPLDCLLTLLLARMLAGLLACLLACLLVFAYG